MYLADKVRAFLNEKRVKHLVSANHETLGNIPYDDITNNHEEADTLMILHCISFSSSATTDPCSITVFCPDTDVACLLIAFKDQMIQNIYMDTGVRLIHIDSVFQSLGEKKAKALLSLHALSGCDTTGRFQGKGKKSWWKVFTKCTDEQLMAIKSIQDEDPLKHFSTQQEVIAWLYNAKSKDVADARWTLFKKFSYESEPLPPTAGSLKQAILRAHCQARTWFLSDKSTRLLPDPLSCEWEILEEVHRPKTSDTPVAPDSVLNLIKCGCGSDCLSRRCRKNNLVCTELCECGDMCQNSDVERFVNDEALEEDEMFDEMSL